MSGWKLSQGGATGFATVTPSPSPALAGYSGQNGFSFGSVSGDLPLSVSQTQGYSKKACVRVLCPDKLGDLDLAALPPGIPGSGAFKALDLLRKGQRQH